MKISFRRSHLAVALLGTFAAPFLNSSAQAAPSGYAPASGYRNKRGNRNINVTGVVTRDLVGQDRFTVRLDSGRSVEVISRDREPVRLSRGDRVRLRGDFEGTLFIADKVRITNNVGGTGGNPAQAATLSGRVTRDFVGRDFEVRRDNGTTTRVRSLRAEPIRLTSGDRVSVSGHFEGALFMARTVDIQRNNDRQSVNFPATVLRRIESGRLSVRGDNGRTYTVISNVSLARFDRDDRVRVRGFVNGCIVSAESVVLLKNR